MIFPLKGPRFHRPLARSWVDCIRRSKNTNHLHWRWEDDSLKFQFKYYNFSYLFCRHCPLCKHVRAKRQRFLAAKASSWKDSRVFARSGWRWKWKWDLTPCHDGEESHQLNIKPSLSIKTIPILVMPNNLSLFRNWNEKTQIANFF